MVGSGRRRKFKRLGTPWVSVHCSRVPEKIPQFPSLTLLGMRRNKGSPHEEGPPCRLETRKSVGGQPKKRDQMVLGQGERLVSGEEKKVLRLPLPLIFKILVKIYIYFSFASKLVP